MHQKWRNNGNFRSNKAYRPFLAKKKTRKPSLRVLFNSLYGYLSRLRPLLASIRIRSAFSLINPAASC
jgi:hypothetical protein